MLPFHLNHRTIFLTPLVWFLVNPFCEHLKYVRNRLVRVECVSVLGVGNECVTWSVISLPNWSCASPSSLTMPFRSGLNLLQGCSQAFPSTLRMRFSGVLLFLPFSVWEDWTELWWDMFLSSMTVFYWNAFIMMCIWQINILTFSCWTTSHNCNKLYNK